VLDTGTGEDDEIDESDKDSDSEVISILRDDTQYVMEL
jgi:hypothetical protein